MEPVVEGVTFYVKYLGSSLVVILMIMEIKSNNKNIIHNTSFCVKYLGSSVVVILMIMEINLVLI